MTLVMVCNSKSFDTPENYGFYKEKLTHILNRLQYEEYFYESALDLEFLVELNFEKGDRLRNLFIEEYKIIGSVVTDRNEMLKRLDDKSLVVLFWDEQSKAIEKISKYCKDKKISCFVIYVERESKNYGLIKRV